MVEKTKYAMKQVSAFLPEMIARTFGHTGVEPDGLASNRKQNRGKKIKVPGLGGVDCNHHHNKGIDMSPKAASLTLHFTEKENNIRRRK